MVKSLDSSMGIAFSGGKTVVISTSGGNSAIDSEKGYSYTGGSVLALMPSNGMTSETTKCNSSNGFASVGTKTTMSLSSGQVLSVKVAGSTVMTVEMPCGLSAMALYLGSNSATFAAA